MSVETQAWEEPPGSSSPNSGAIGNHGADVQLRARTRVSIPAATELSFPLNKRTASATNDQKLQKIQEDTGREWEKSIASGHIPFASRRNVQ